MSDPKSKSGILLAQQPNPSPKARFQTLSAAVAEHHVMVDSVAFRRAADYAMLQYQQYISEQVKDGNTAMCAGFKLQGALEFLAQFKMLADNPVFTPRTTEDNLDHKV